MEGIIFLLLFIGFAILALSFYINHRDSEGVIGLLANIVGFIYHKFWLLLIIGLTLFCFFSYGFG